MSGRKKEEVRWAYIWSVAEVGLVVRVPKGGRLKEPRRRDEKGRRVEAGEEGGVAEQE